MAPQLRKWPVLENALREVLAAEGIDLVEPQGKGDHLGTELLGITTEGHDITFRLMESSWSEAEDGVKREEFSRTFTI